MKFFTDWEGPWILNDMVYDLCKYLFKDEEFFRRLSQYDDYLAYVEKMTNYSAGDTLRLVAPFLVAIDVKEEDFKKVTSSVKFIEDAYNAMSFLTKKYTPVVISTTYEICLKETAKKIGIHDNLYGTKLTLKNYKINERWKNWLIRKVDEISSLPEIDIKNPNKKATEYLNRLFWKEIKNSPFWKVMNDVIVINAEKKREIADRCKGSVIAIGDSISDVKMLELAKNRGVAIAFNGNEFALEYADVAIISKTAYSEAMIVDIFLSRGKEGLLEYEKSDHILLDKLKDTEIYFDINEDVIEKSLKMRKKLRGEAGELG